MNPHLSNISLELSFRQRHHRVDDGTSFLIAEPARELDADGDGLVGSLAIGADRGIDVLGIHVFAPKNEPSVT